MRGITRARRSGPAPEIMQTIGRGRLLIRATKGPTLARTIGWAQAMRRRGILRLIVALANPEAPVQIPAIHKWRVLRLEADQRRDRRHSPRRDQRHSLLRARPRRRRTALSPPTPEHSGEQAIPRVIAPRALAGRPAWVTRRGLAVAGEGNNNA